MKKFFAKYLAVPGEIKESDRAFWNVQTNRVFAPSLDEKNIGNWKSLLRKVRTAQHRPVKLFLCTRDIQVGDKFDQFPGINGHCYECKDVGKDFILDDEGKSRTKGTCFKVIGEISPEATWVREGDKFNKDEIQNWGICSEEGHHFHNHAYGKDIAYHAKHSSGEIKGCPFECDCECNGYFKIKGPCGHFH